MKIIKRLRALLAEATPGPWIYLGTPRGYEVLVPSWTKEDADLKHAENMKLLEAAVKSLPALLDVAEAARAYWQAHEDIVAARNHLTMEAAMIARDEAAAALRNALARLKGVE